MNYNDTAQEAAFREELRSWLASNTPAARPPERDEEAFFRFTNDWHRSLYAGGWLGLSWPVEAGGRGLSPIYEGILNEEIGRATAPSTPRNIGYLGRALIAYGTPDQQQRYLPTLLRGDEIWCQGFSEPGAGSDLASLRTRADLQGERYILNGQKVWTTFAKWSDWCLLLARTDHDVARHKGISALVLRVDSPGVSVRPIHQIDESEELGEIFFDDVEVPVSQRIGPSGGGWELAMRTLTYERGPADIGFIARAQRELHEMEATVAASGAGATTTEIGRRMAQVYVHLEVLRLQVKRSLSSRLKGDPGPESSADKMLMVKAAQDLARLREDIAGVDAVVGDDVEALHAYLRSRSVSIYGGSAQIQKNIIAQRVLGMPRQSV
jgi:alkylation response protein AidB-like acyl-CoA dehydrogenase